MLTPRKSTNTHINDLVDYHEFTDLDKPQAARHAQQPAPSLFPLYVLCSGRPSSYLKERRLRPARGFGPGFYVRQLAALAKRAAVATSAADLFAST